MSSAGAKVLYGIAHALVNTASACRSPTVNSTSAAGTSTLAMTSGVVVVMGRAGYLPLIPMSIRMRRALRTAIPQQLTLPGRA